jgi:hypothetical protein
VLSIEEEAVIVAFRPHMLLLLDDCLYALQATIPRLKYFSLHRCLQRHGIGRLPDVEGKRPRNGSSRATRSDTFHRHCRGENRAGQAAHAAIDRTSKIGFVELHDKATAAVPDFLLTLIAAIPYRIHTVLTDRDAVYHARSRGSAVPTGNVLDND